MRFRLTSSIKWIALKLISAERIEKSQTHLANGRQGSTWNAVDEKIYIKMRLVLDLVRGIPTEMTNSNYDFAIEFSAIRLVKFPFHFNAGILHIRAVNFLTPKLFTSILNSMHIVSIVIEIGIRMSHEYMSNEISTKQTQRRLMSFNTISFIV